MKPDGNSHIAHLSIVVGVVYDAHPNLFVHASKVKVSVHGVLHVCISIEFD